MEDGRSNELNNNERNPNKIRTFTDLETWKVGHALVLEIYTVTRYFPREETYGLTGQMRRSAVSITSNIAEGFGRRSIKEKVQFYNTARGSLIELYNQLLIARDVKYFSVEQFNLLDLQHHSLHRLLNALITKTNTTFR